MLITAQKWIEKLTTERQKQNKWNGQQMYSGSYKLPNSNVSIQNSQYVQNSL